MADYFFADDMESGLHRHDWLKLAVMFALFALMMVAVMCLAVRLVTPP
ncbi:MAG TPA: hypothetical protein VMZ71_12650 [Gemmataceae bacterium]|nr:hypothetical protein [Gemmataceae bacterium]